MELPHALNQPAMKVALLGVYIALSTYGLYQLKSSGLWSLSFGVGFVCYGLGFLLWMVILRSLPLSIAFPSAAGGLIVATQLTGHFVLNEVLRPVQWVGVLLVLLAIALIYVPDTSGATS